MTERKGSEDPTVADSPSASKQAPTAGVAPAAARQDSEREFPALSTIDPDNYLVGRELAAGGMGRIFEAHDRRLGRPVAIKQLLTRSPKLRARFEREACITARLQHPAIVNVLEAGVWPDGEPFFAMRLVSGESFDKVIKQATTFAERMALLPHAIAATEALAYAHSRHVIHRDLKPANILVGEFGETVVIDWGLAKDLSASEDDPAPAAGPYRTEASLPGQTEAGEVMGTPGYMPVEQARGEPVDARADVYALGAMLYYLFSGKAPYGGKSSKAVLADVIARPPPPLAMRTTEVPRDLVAIIDKAMARDANDRYPDARALAEDLKRFQTGQLVGAHQYSSWQLLRRWLGRHRLPVATVSVSVIALAVVGALSVRGIVNERERTDAARALVAKNRDQVEDLLGFMLGDLRAKLKPLGKLDVLASVTSKAASYYDDRPGGTDSDQLRRTMALTQIGEVLRDQGALPEARKQFEAALAIAERERTAHPASTEWQHAALEASVRIAAVMREQAQLESALAAAKRALAIAATLEKATDLAVRRDIAVSHDTLGSVLDARGDAKGALEEYRRGRAILESLGDDSAALVELADNHRAIGKLTGVDLGDVAGGLAEYRTALAIDEKLVSAEPANSERRRELGIGHNRVGNMLDKEGKLTESLAEYRKGQQISSELAASDPSNTVWQSDLGASAELVAGGLDLTGDVVGAIAAQRTSVAIAEQLAAKDPTNASWQLDLAEAHLKLGSYLREHGDNDGALAEHRAELAIAEQVTAKDSTNSLAQRHHAMALMAMGDILLVKGDAQGALDKFTDATKVAAARSAVDPANTTALRELAIAEDKLGNARLARGDHAGALEGHQRALALFQQLAAKDLNNAELQRDVMIALEKVGDTQLAAKDATAATATYRKELAIAQALHDRDHDDQRALEDLAYAHGKVGEVLVETGAPKDGLVELHASLELWDPIVAKDPGNVDALEMLANVHGDFGEAHRALHDKAGAAREYRAAIAMQQRVVAASHGDTERAKTLADLRSKLAKLH